MNKFDEVITIATLQGLWPSYSFNKAELLKLEGKKVLIVNEKEKRICGVIEFHKPPKRFVAKVIYKL